MASKKRSTQKAHLDDEEAPPNKQPRYNPEANLIEEHIKRALNGYLLALVAFLRWYKGRDLPLYEENGQIYGYAHLQEVAPQLMDRLWRLVPLATEHKAQDSEVQIDGQWFSVNIWNGALTQEDRDSWKLHSKWVKAEFKRLHPEYKYKPKQKKQKVAKKPKGSAPPKQRFTVPGSHYDVPQAPIASGSCIAGPSNPPPSQARTVKRRRGDDDDETAPTRQPAKRARGSVMQSPALYHRQALVAPLLPLPRSPLSSSSSHPPFTPARGLTPMNGSPAFWQQASFGPAPNTGACLPSPSTQQRNNPSRADAYPTPIAQGTPHMQCFAGPSSTRSAYTNSVAHAGDPSIKQSILPRSFNPQNDYVPQPTRDVRAQRASLLNPLGLPFGSIPPRIPDDNVLAFDCSDVYGISHGSNADADNYDAQNNVVDALRTPAPLPLEEVFDQGAMRVAYGSSYGYDDASSFPASPVGPSYSYADRLPYSSQAGSGYLGHVHEYSHTYNTFATDAARPSPSRTSVNLSPTGASHHSATPAAALASTASNTTNSANTPAFNTFELWGIP